MSKIKPIEKLNVKEPYLVKVVWIDAIGWSGWFTEEDLVDWMNGNARPVIETGWLMHKDDHGILIASKKHEMAEITKWGDPTWIPADWIKSIKRLK